MKCFSILLLFSMYVMPVSAQPWLPDDVSGRIKLQDVIDNYKKEHAEDHDKEQTIGKARQEYDEDDQDFQFDRWVWYWQRHCDENGYLVPTSKGWNSWQAYTQKRATLGRMAKTAGTNPSYWTIQGSDLTATAFLFAGRVNTVVCDPADTGTLWLATPGGGAWKSVNSGANWTCMTDNIAAAGISDIGINPLNHNTIYLCTGDRDGGNFFSIGVLKSVDGGNTWNTTGLKWNDTNFALTNSITINRVDTNSVIVAARDGIYVSHNGGDTWTMTQPGFFKQVQYNAADTNVVYAASQYFLRSADGGNTWDTIKTIPKYNQVRFSTSAAYPNVIKLVGAVSTGLGGVYASSDAGKTFRETYAGSCSTNLLGYSLTNCGGQTGYDLAIAMNPLDTDKVYVGGIFGWYSPDGGYNWSQLNESVHYPSGVTSMHFDIHAFVFHPSVPNRLYECNDGGIYVGDNPSAGSWWDAINNGLDVKQYYKIAVNNAVPYIIGGAQDDGSSKVHDGNTISLNGYADGAQCQLDGTDTTVYYTSQSYGTIWRCMTSALFTGTPISENIPGRPTGIWLTPFVLEPQCHKCIIAGYDQLYLSTDQGDTWSGISASGTAIAYIGVTPADSKTIYFVRQNTSEVNYTHDGGATWSVLSCPYSGYISNLTVDAKNKDHFWLTFGNGNVNLTATSIAEYSAATGWRDAGAGIPPYIAITCLAQDSISGDLYAGADYGVFYRTPSMTDWEPFSNHLVTAGIDDMGINYAAGEIWAGTFGRGIWRSPLNSNTGISIVPFLANTLTIYPNPSHGIFTIKAANAWAGKTVFVTVTNSAGKLVWTGEATFDGNGAAGITATGLAAGIYVVQAATATSVIGRQKLMIY